LIRAKAQRFARALRVTTPYASTMRSTG
jgi:hypothetical protein